MNERVVSVVAIAGIIFCSALHAATLYAIFTLQLIVMPISFCMFALSVFIAVSGSVQWVSFFKKKKYLIAAVYVNTLTFIVGMLLFATVIIQGLPLVIKISPPRTVIGR